MKSEDASPIARLPLEILEAFIEISSKSSQLSIARVSKLFHSLSLRSLYRHISLDSSSIVVGCCRSLARNSVLAATVRSFQIAYTPEPYINYKLAAYYRNIRVALHSLVHLHTLRLLVHDNNIVGVLRPCIFPALRRFECSLTLSTPLVHFLNHHPHLVSLQISSLEKIGEPEEEEELPPLSLPKLQYFTGNGESVPALKDSAPLRAAFVSWNARDTPPELVITTLQQSSGHTLHVLSCKRRGWNNDLIDIISTRLSELISLQISNVLVVDSHPTESYINEINVYISRFTKLQRLRINCIDYWEMGNIQCRMDVDFSTVKNWGASCATLVEIALPHSNDLSWYRISQNVWIPDPTHVLGAAWLSDAIVLNKYPALDLLVEGMQDRTDRGPISPLEYVETIAAVRQKFYAFLGTRHADLVLPGGLPEGVSDHRKIKFTSC